MHNSKYKDDFPERAGEYAAAGLIDKEIASKLGISHMSFYRYLKDHDDFREAVEEGKKPADVEVEQALFKRAIGFEYKETTTIDGTITKEVVKYAAPETAACIFWLKNRTRNSHRAWRDRFPEDLKEEFGNTTIHVTLPDELDTDANLTEHRRGLYQRLYAAQATIRDRDRKEYESTSDAELELKISGMEYRAEHPDENAIERLMAEINNLRERREDIEKQDLAVKEDDLENGMADPQAQTKEDDTRAAETSETKETRAENRQEAPGSVRAGPISSLVKHPDDILD